MTPLHRAAAVAAALSCLPLVPALAVDPVDRSRVGAVRLELADGAGGTLRLALRVWDGASADRVDVRVESCDAAGCSYPAFYAGVVDAATAQLDPAQASGRAVLALAGHEIALTWEPAAQSGVVLGAGEVTGSGESVTAGAYVGTPAVVTVGAAGGGCATPGAVGDGIRLALPEGSSGATRPLSALQLPAGTLGCPAAD
jgi:hypothetical protein